MKRTTTGGKRAAGDSVRAARDRVARLQSENRRLRARVAELEAGRAVSAGVAAGAGRADVAGVAGPAGGAAGVTLRLRLLGAPRLSIERSGATAEVPIRLRRGLYVLACLALAPERRMLKADLIEALWPEADPQVPDRNFHPTLSVVRESVRGALDAPPPAPAVIVVRRGGCELDRALTWEVDTEVFAAAATAGNACAAGDPEAAAAWWRRAWQLYGGPLLQGTEAGWIEAPRDALHRRYVEVLGSLGELEARHGRLAEAVDAYRGLLAVEPLVESAHVALLRAYARQGRRDLVRRHYENLVRLLRSELGVEPQLKTTLDYHALMA